MLTAVATGCRKGVVPPIAMERMRTTSGLKAALAVAALGLAVARLVFEDAGGRMDETFFALLAAAALILLVPWERLTTLKAAGVELALEPQVRGAVETLSLANPEAVDDERLLAELRRLAPEIDKARGSRVLWIDDRPHEIVAERRLLRALGIEVVPASSSSEALRLLERDNDFDLVVSDVQRAGESYKQTGGIPIHEGVNFVVASLRRDANELIRSLPVLFYAAYPWPRLVEFTRPARELSPDPELANAPDALVTKTVRLLAEARSRPITVGRAKAPTSVA